MGLISVFNNDENHNSILDGVTVINGCAKGGGAIYCGNYTGNFIERLHNANTIELAQETITSFTPLELVLTLRAVSATLPSILITCKNDIVFRT